MLSSGGRLYDRWYAAQGKPGPTANHPSWPTDNTSISAADTWRCKSCHGWDYLGRDGQYKSGANATGIRGIQRMKDRPIDEIYSILENQTHRFTDDLIPGHAKRRLAMFVSRGQHTVAQHFGPNGEPRGDPAAGKAIFQNMCAACHAFDGRGRKLGISADPDFNGDPMYVGTKAANGPVEVLHKIRNGHPGAIMISLRAFSMQSAVDVLAYVRNCRRASVAKQQLAWKTRPLPCLMPVSDVCAHQFLLRQDREIDSGASMPLKLAHADDEGRAPAVMATSTPLLRRYSNGLLLGLAVAFVADMPVAFAGGFDVKGAEIAKGETEIGFNSAYFTGFPVNADRLRATGEISAGYGFSEWWKAGVKLSFDQPVGGDLEAVTAGVEAQILFRKMEGRGPAIAWFMGVDAAIQSDQTNTLTFGPIWSWALDDKTAFNLNTFFATTFGRNSEDAVDFSYAWQVKREIREGFGIGIEGYGVLPDIGHWPGVDFQEHRIGPVLYIERSLKHPGELTRGSIKDAKAATVTVKAVPN